MDGSQGSKHRILEAATAEFAAVGIAGARVDRIAAASGMNKSQIYYYFGSKEGLFDAVLQENLGRITDAVPLMAEDLPGYAVRLCDSYVEHPEFLRLAMWERIERVHGGDLFGEHDERKLGAIAEVQRAGLVDPSLEPAEVISVVVAIAMTWSPVSVTYAASTDDPDPDHARRRSIVARTVSRALLITRDEGTPVGRGHSSEEGSSSP